MADTVTPVVDRPPEHVDLPDEHAEQTCEVLIISLLGFIGEIRSERPCGEPAHWVGHTRCPEHGPFTRLLCDKHKNAVGQQQIICGLCTAWVVVTCVEPLR